MKKILALSMVLALSTGMTLAATNYGSTLKNAVKQDIQSTKEAVKKDVQTKNETNAAQSQAKKQEKIKQIDAKLTELNNEMETVKKSKEITETEKTIRTKSIQRQIDFYNKQKAALQ